MDSGIEILTNTNDQPDEGVYELILQFVRSFLSYYRISRACLSIHLVDQDSIQDLNKTYRDRDYPTDILSFPQYESIEEIYSDLKTTQLVHLGDIVLSLKEVEQNCREFSMPFVEELPRLIIHGMLHIIGEDHQSYDKEEPMLAKQEYLLRKLK